MDQKKKRKGKTKQKKKKNNNKKPTETICNRTNYQKLSRNRKTMI